MSGVAGAECFSLVVARFTSMQNVNRSCGRVSAQPSIVQQAHSTVIEAAALYGVPQALYGDRGSRTPERSPKHPRSKTETASSES